MLKFLALVVALLSPASSPEFAVEATVLPSRPYLETSRGNKLLNFDVILHNSGRTPVQLAAVREQVFDAKGRLEAERERNANGSPSALAGLGDLTLQPGAYASIFHPFDRYDAAVDVFRVRLEFIFLQTGKPIPPVALSGDVTASVDVQPRAFHPPSYCLPMSGRLLVHDGHDIASHHRRRNLAAAYAADPRTAANANLYAYDFVRIDDEGRLFAGDPNKKESWFTFGAPVLAPTEGIVVEAADGIPDNSFVSGKAIVPEQAQRLDPGGFGNHVTIRAADGRVSWLLHLEAGTVTVHSGQMVKAGDRLGRIGFSGDSLFPHLHYTVTERPDYPSPSAPSYFRAFRRLLGAKAVRVDYGQIDTGDIVMQAVDKSCPRP